MTRRVLGLRMGLILGALWLAWPDLHRLPKWVWYILPVAVVVLLYARALLVYLIPAFAVVAVSYMLYRRLWRFAVAVKTRRMQVMSVRKNSWRAEQFVFAAQ